MFPLFTITTHTQHQKRKKSFERKFMQQNDKSAKDEKKFCWINCKSFRIETENKKKTRGKILRLKAFLNNKLLSSFGGIFTICKFFHYSLCTTQNETGR